MEYMLMIYEGASEAKRRAEGTQGEAYKGAWSAYTQALIDAGAFKSGNVLAPHTSSTTVTKREGKRWVQDGPYADTKEQLAGYYIIEVEDLDVALDWAARCPGAATGVIEVRPIGTQG